MNVHLVDGSFFPRERSATLTGERSGQGPQAFEWTQGPGGPVTFYTDMCLSEARAKTGGRKVAWLLEPPWKPAHYEKAAELVDVFDYILTYWANCAGLGNRRLFYPLGGSWLADDEKGTEDDDS